MTGEWEGMFNNNIKCAYAGQLNKFTRLRAPPKGRYNDSVIFLVVHYIGG
jgi:hypothetical protein